MTAASPVTIRKIGIIGAGRIGCGTAHVCAMSGFDVYLVDISTEALERTMWFCQISGQLAESAPSG
jgi:3-hydroxybutyryl-CoA dehydrogenase